MRTLWTPALLIAALAGSGVYPQRIEERKDRQDARIKEGRQSGQLTDKEAARLKAREAALNRKIRQDRKDGKGLTPAERARIEKRQDKISEDIYKQKHDAQTKAPK